MSPIPEHLASALSDRYRIERELGAGGMATVYLAEDLKHDRKVAIKVLKPELAAVLGAERFVQEIKTTAQLQHPHILPLFDSGTAAGFLYYVMPYLEGETVREKLNRETQLGVEEAVKITTEVADALDYAHRHGVIHRDIKPENIMVSGRHALVMDFGVAKAVSEATGRNRLTTAGVALGTPTYMAPEQASADPNLDQRVDIYALGVLGYELLSGQPPFTGGTPQQVLAAQVATPPEPLTARRSSVSPALAAVIMRALEKRPADRWQTADEMLAQLEPLATPSGGLTPAQSQPASPVAVRKRRWVPMALGALSAAVLVTLGVLLFGRPPAVAALGKATRVTMSAGVQEMPRVTPDGKGVAYTLMSATDSVERLAFRRAGGGAAIQLASNARPLAWSPDGDRLLIATDRGLESIPALGGPGRLVVPGAQDGTWSPDGQRVAFVSGDSLMVRDADGRVRMLTPSSHPYSPAWSPDGAWIAFASGNFRWLQNWNIAPSSLWLVRATGGAAIRLTGGTSMDQSPAWAPDGRRLLFVSDRNGTRDIYQLDLGADGHPASPPIQLTHGLNASLISLTPDGKTLAYSVATDHSNVWSVAVPARGWVSSREAKLVTTDRERIETFDVSRDGKWLVFDSDRSGLQQIFRRPLAGGEVQQITHDTVPAFVPQLSPDGSEVAYHTIVHGLRRVFETATDGSGTPVEVSPGSSTNEYGPYWSPDGRRISWWQGPFGAFTAWAFAIRAGRSWKAAQLAQAPAPGDLLWPTWVDGTSLGGVDAAGRLIAFPVGRAGTERILASPPAALDSLFRSAVGLRIDPVLSKDGRSLLVGHDLRRNGQTRSGIYRLTLANGQLREVLRFDDPLHPHRVAMHNIAEQGGRLYFTLGSPESSVWTVSLEGLAR